MQRQTALRASTTATAVMLALAGCGSDGGGAGADGSERLLVESTGTLPHLNPQLVQSPSVQQVGSAMLEPLVRITDDYELVPWLAHSWDISDDGMEVTLHLEEDVSWHDGEPFTSEDVKFNVEEIMELQSFGAHLVASIDSVETPDEHTVVLHMSRPYGPLLQALALQFILPEHIYAGTDYVTNPANLEPVGTGPMVFESFAEGDSAELVKNTEYWGGEVQVDRAVFPVTTDPNARDLALLAGELDRAAYVGKSKLSEIEADPNLETTDRGVLPQQVVFTMNTDNEVLSDPTVRQLVYSTVDRAEVASTAMPDSTVPEGIFPPAADWANSPDVDLAEDFPYDVEAINNALDEAGFPEQADGWRFTLDLHYMSALADAAAVGEVMKSTMAEVGIDLDLQGLDTTVFTEKVYAQRDFDTAIVISTASTDPSLGITRWYTCNPDKDAAKNPSGLCDDEIDEAADGALHSSGQETRAEYFHQLDERAAEVMVSAPVVYMSAMTVYNTSRWEGLDNANGLNGTDWVNLKPRD